jgi:MFS family permease
MPSTSSAALPGQRSWLLPLCLGRTATTFLAMTYSACVPELIPAWHLSAVEAGTIQAAVNIGFAVSLLLASWLADKVGAKRVLLVSTWLSAVSALVFALLARSYLSAMLFGALTGLAQGGTYTPAIMLVSEQVPPARRGSALGWLLASSSLGYVGSLLVSWVGLELQGYRMAFLLSALGPALGIVATSSAVRGLPNLIHARVEARFAWGRILRDRRSLLLTLGYTAHAWELFGLWAWSPAFLVACLGGAAGDGSLGLWIAALLHVSGTAASFTVGRASDRLGRRRVLFGVAAASTLCSFAYGWTIGLPIALVLALTVLYGFLAIGDSPVLSTAMTEAVPAGYLGSALALRSVLGFGAGAVAPVAFGAILDSAQAAGMGLRGWSWGFMALGVGGAVAALCALLLPEPPKTER